MAFVAQHQYHHQQQQQQQLADAAAVAAAAREVYHKGVRTEEEGLCSGVAPVVQGRGQGSPMEVCSAAAAPLSPYHQQRQQEQQEQQQYHHNRPHDEDDSISSISAMSSEASVGDTEDEREENSPGPQKQHTSPTPTPPPAAAAAALPASSSFSSSSSSRSSSSSIVDNHGGLRSLALAVSSLCSPPLSMDGNTDRCRSSFSSSSSSSSSTCKLVLPSSPQQMQKQGQQQLQQFVAAKPTMVPSQCMRDVISLLFSAMRQEEDGARRGLLQDALDAATQEVPAMVNLVEGVLGCSTSGFSLRNENDRLFLLDQLMTATHRGVFGPRSHHW